MSAVCRIEMLGGLRVTVLDRTVTRFQTQKTGALLAYLAMNPARIHAREAIAELLWPEGDPNAIRNRLNQAVSSLRRQVHPPGIESDGIIVATHHTLSLNHAAIETDVSQFQKQARLVATTDSPEQQLKHAREAVRLYQGDLLTGYFEDWILNERMYLSEQAVDVMDKLLRLLYDAGEIQEAITIAVQRLAFDPHDEATHARLMRLYLRVGRPRAALRQFDELLRAVRSEGSEPSPTSLRLKLRAEAEIEDHPIEDESPVAPPTVVRAEPVLQILQSEEATRGVPQYFSKFVGREADQARLNTWFFESESRIATLTAPGGMGKTRLSSEFAGQIASTGSRVLFGQLANLSSDEEIVPLLARLIHSGDVREPLSQIGAWLSGSERPLIILDNYEDLVDKPQDILGSLLALSPHVKILITSRRSLGRSDEQILKLEPLPLPHLSNQSVAELSQNPTVRLFVSRAQAAKQDFQLTERTADMIALLCRRLGGYPLAVELAASWTRSMTPGQMAEEIGSRFELLADRRKDLADRHRSMVAVMESCVSQVSPQAQDLFHRLSLFQGGWSATAAQAIAPELDAVVLLDELIEHSLVDAKDGPTRIWYSMLDLLKRYGSELLSDQTQASCRELATNFFINEARRWDSVMGLESDEEFGEDQANFAETFEILLQANRIDEAGELVVSLAPYYRNAGLSRSCLDLIERILAARPKDASVQCSAKFRQAQLLWWLGEFERSFGIVSEVLPELEKFQKTRLVAEAHLVLAMEKHRREDFPAAKDELELAATVARAAEHWAAVETAWRRKGNVLLELGEPESAFEAYSESLRVARDHNFTGRLLDSLITLANFGLETNALESADAWLTEAQALADHKGSFIHRSYISLERCRLEVRRNNLEAALQIAKPLVANRIEDVVLSEAILSIIAELLAALDDSSAAAKIVGHVEENLRTGRSQQMGLVAKRFVDLKGQIRTNLGKSKFEENVTIGKSFSHRQIWDLAHQAVSSAIERTNRVISNS